jgi:serine/threonine protein kinase
METIILNCIEKDPNKRYQTVGVFLRDLELSKMNLPLLAKRSEISIFNSKGLKNILKLILVLMMSIIVSGSVVLAYNVRNGNIKQLDFSVLQSKIISLFSKKSKVTKNAALTAGQIPVPILEEIADVLYLNNGVVVMGIIESIDEDNVSIKLKIGTITYPKQEISDIKYSTPSKRQQLLELWDKK